MTRSDFISGLLFAVLGVAAGLEAASFGLGTPAEPGAGFLPFGASALMVICALALIVQALLPPRALPGPLPEAAVGPTTSAGMRKVWICVGSLLVYAVCLPLIGFSLSTFVVMFVLSHLDSRTSWWGSLAIAGVGTLGFWVMFVHLLAVSFPVSAIGY